VMKSAVDDDGAESEVFSLGLLAFLDFLRHQRDSIWSHGPRRTDYSFLSFFVQVHKFGGEAKT
jgi:hypothetical protein